jgi:hypothetical protein
LRKVVNEAEKERSKIEVRITELEKIAVQNVGEVLRSQGIQDKFREGKTKETPNYRQR